MISLRFAIYVLAAVLGFASQTSSSTTEKSAAAEPKLPVIDFNACGSSDSGPNSPDKITRQERMYSSWKAKRVLLRVLRPGDEYTLIGGVNIVHEPDRAVVINKTPEAPFLKPGDTVLGYGYHADGTIAFWTNGVWFKEDYEHISTMDADCGFADKTECTIKITKPGVKEWWVQVKTSGDLKGWVLGATFHGDKTTRTGMLDQMCQD